MFAPQTLDAVLPARTYGNTVTVQNYSVPRTAVLLGGAHSYPSGLTFNNVATSSLTIDAATNAPQITATVVTLSGAGVRRAGRKRGSKRLDKCLKTSRFQRARSWRRDQASRVFNNFNLAASAAFNGGTSTVTFVGAAGSTSTITGSASFYNLIVNTPAKWIDFAAGSTTTVTNLTLAGTSGNLVGVRSTTPGQFSYLDNTGINAVTFVDVADNNASGGLTIHADGFSNNSGHNVNWTFGAAPNNPRITNVYVSSLTVTYGTATGNGYSLEASTMSDFSGTVISSVTPNASVSTMTFNTAQLAPNTTYFVRIGNIVSNSTNYALTTPVSTSTLANMVSGAQTATIGYSNISVNWLPFSAGSGAGTAEGYTLLMSTASDFHRYGHCHQPPIAWRSVR